MNKNLHNQESMLAIAFVLIFVLSLIIRVWFNFLDTHANAAFACDAAEYLRDAQSLDLSLCKIKENPSCLWLCIKVLAGCANIAETNQVKETLGPLQGISIAGPVFPAFLLACFKMCGQNPSFQSWGIPVAVQCLLSALTVVLIMGIGITCWGRMTGIMAGLLAACYPGFIVNTGRLYSESFACFLICIVLWLISCYWVNGRSGFNGGFLLGISLWTLQITRSIMVGLSLGILAVLFTSGFLVTGRRLPIAKYLLAMVIAFLLCLLPWLALQKLALGKTSFVVDRCSQYNLLIGNDVDGLGWLSIPYQDCSSVGHQGDGRVRRTSYWHIIKDAIQKSPERWFKLMLDKPVRLLKLPWNDFKTGIGIICPATQAVIHQLILVLAAIGVIVINMRTGKEFQRPKMIARLTILFAFLLHFAYLAFITVPRYALTAMPEIILFAGAGMATIFYACKSKPTISAALRLLLAIAMLMVFSQVNLIQLLVPLNNADFILSIFWLYAGILLKLAVICLFFAACWQLVICLNCKNSYLFASHKPIYSLLIIILLTIFTLPAYCLPLRAHGRWYEWSQILDNKNGKIERIIRLEKRLADELVNNGAYLAINLEDGANLSTQGNLLVNGVRLDAPFIPALALCQDLNLVKRQSNNQLIAEQEYIFQCLCNACSKSPLDLRQWYFVPVNGDQWQKVINKADQSSQFKNSKILQVILQKRGNDNCTIFGAYPSGEHFSMMPSLSRFSWEKAFYGVENESGFNDPFYDEKVQSIPHADPYIKLLVPQHNVFLRVINEQYQEGDITKENAIVFHPKTSVLAGNQPNNCWLIRLTGNLWKIDTDKLESLPWTDIGFTSTNRKNNSLLLSYRPPWAPTYFYSDLQMKSSSILKFDYCFPMVLAAFPGQLDRIELHRPDNETKNMSVQCRLRIYQMPKLSSGVPYEVF